MKLILQNETYCVVDLFGTKKFQFKDKDTAVLKLRSMGVFGDAIDEAFQDFKDKQTNTAHFGYRGTFMFSEHLKGINYGF